jgi:sulfur transfer complex TusBCD TusB component (DsrH family)
MTHILYKYEYNNKTNLKLPVCKYADWMYLVQDGVHLQTYKFSGSLKFGELLGKLRDCCIRSEVLTAVTMKSSIFCDKPSCSLVAATNISPPSSGLKSKQSTKPT